MEPKELISLFFNAISLMLTMAGGFFGFWKFASNRIDKHFEKLQKDIDTHRAETKEKISRAYDRMDEKVDECIRKDIHDKDIAFLKELNKQEVIALMKTMETEFKYVNEKLDKLIRHDDERSIGRGLK